LDAQSLTDWLKDGDEHERAWVIRLGLDGSKAGDGFLGECVQVARKGSSSPLVRLSLASALQRLPGRNANWVDSYWSIARELVRRQEDAHDPYLPLMIWYRIEPQGERDPASGL